MNRGEQGQEQAQGAGQNPGLCPYHGTGYKPTQCFYCAKIIMNSWNWKAGKLLDDHGQEKAVAVGLRIECDSNQTKKLIASAPDLLAQNQALRLANDRLMEACRIAAGAETMTLKLKRILLDAIAAAEQEQEH